MLRLLDGIKVIECCQFVAGPYCTKLLAEAGAEVIKVEPPGVGDKARRRGPFPDNIPHPERSGLFLYLNTNKMGITLDLNHPQGKKILRELVKKADILVEDYSPKTARKLGLNYGSLKRVNPRLIVTSITPFGQTGPYKEYKAYCLNISHGGGEGYLQPGGTTYLDRPPVKVGGFVEDYDAGISAAVATLGALYWQGMTGLGQHIDVSKQEVMASLFLVDLPRYLNEQLVVSRVNQGHTMGGVLPSKNRYFSVVWFYQHEWERFLKLMGDPEWAKDERFRTIINARLNGEEANAHITAWAMEHTKEEIYHQGQAAGVPTAIVATTEYLVNSEHLNQRGFFVEIDHPEAKRLKYPSALGHCIGADHRQDRAAPLLGEHNEEIYCKRLGYEKRDLVRLRGAGII